jgi:hypothetical protein
LVPLALFIVGSESLSQLRPSVGGRLRVSLGWEAFCVLALPKGENISRSNVECFLRSNPGHRTCVTRWATDCEHEDFRLRPENSVGP